jgi:hypothetical protein
MVVWVVLVLFAGSADRVYVFLNLSYTHQIWWYRAVVWVAPTVAAVIAYYWCKGLLAAEHVEADQRKAEVEARLARMSP